MALEIKNIKFNTSTNDFHAELHVDGRLSIGASLEYIQEQLQKNPVLAAQVPKFRPKHHSSR
jgi:hypothetical protein